MVTYIIANTKWASRNTFDLVDWESRHKAGTKITRTQRLTVFKLEFHLFETMAKRSKCEKYTSHSCPRCNQAMENFAHVLQCPNAQTTTLQSWETTKTQIQQKRSCLQVISKLEHGILLWLSNNTTIEWPDPIPNISDTIGHLIHSAFSKQCAIGWDQLFRGILSCLWGKAKQHLLPHQTIPNINQKKHYMDTQYAPSITYGNLV
jgi:hypothetical protein